MHKSIRTRLWVGIISFLAVLAFFYPFVSPPLPPVKKFGQDVTSVAPVPDFAAVTPITAKKRAFFYYLKPEVEKQNQEILLDRSFLMAIYEQIRHNELISDRQQQRVREIAKIYAVSYESLSEIVLQKLLLRVDAIPSELVLVQAANESAWGTSRFARNGYNFFGMWCFQKGCGFVPRRRNSNANHEVAKFDSLSKGVAKYLNNLNRHNAYKDFRYIRAALRNTQQPITAEALAEGLLSYSERGQAYVEELQAMVRVNRKYM